jgi:hypothetical protein
MRFAAIFIRSTSRTSFQTSRRVTLGCRARRNINNTNFLRRLIIPSDVPNVPERSSVLQHAPIKMEHALGLELSLVFREFLTEGALPAVDEVVNAVVRDGH